MSPPSQGECKQRLVLRVREIRRGRQGLSLPHEASSLKQGLGTTLPGQRGLHSRLEVKSEDELFSALVQECADTAPTWPAFHRLLLPCSYASRTSACPACTSSAESRPQGEPCTPGNARTARDQYSDGSAGPAPARTSLPKASPALCPLSHCSLRMEDSAHRTRGFRAEDTLEILREGQVSQPQDLKSQVFPDPVPQHCLC